MEGFKNHAELQQFVFDSLNNEGTMDMAVIQERLKHLVDNPEGVMDFYDTSDTSMSNYQGLSTEARARCRALHQHQRKVDDLQRELDAKIAALEASYTSQFDALFQERAAIITGAREVTEEETVFTPLFREDYESEDVTGAAADEPKIKEIKSDDEDNDEDDDDEEELPEDKLPHFWMDCMLNVGDGQLEPLVENDDVPLLSAITNIRQEKQADHVTLFHFDFAENDYIENKTLTLKTVERIDNPDVEYIADAEESTPGRLESTGAIQWKSGKCLYLKKIKKKQKNKKGDVRTVSSEKVLPSFFKIFTKDMSYTDEFDETEQLYWALLDALPDIVSNPLQYYLDLVEDEDEEEDEDDSDEDEDYSDESDDDSDSDEDGATKPKKKSIFDDGGKPSLFSTDAQAKPQQECNQQ